MASQNMEFTIKYRKPNGSWIWANDHSTSTNGEVIFQTSSLPDRLEDSFSKFTETCKIESARSEVSDTRLWSLTYDIPSAGKNSSFGETLLGVPLYVSRWFALVREWAAWLSPRHGKGVFTTSKDAIVCSFLRRDGLHLVLLAISGVDDVLTVFRDDDFGGIVVRARNERPTTNKARIVAAIGHSHETALAACIYHARKIVQGVAVVDEHETSTEPKEPKASWNSQWSDGLGYCTWNALGQNLTDRKIFDALDALEKSNVRIQTLIIDDNWQSLEKSSDDAHYHKWSDFEANPEGFPRGLEKTVTDIRDFHPSIEHVAVWHAMLGYWGGISPTGNIAKQYKTREVTREEVGRQDFPSIKMLVVADEDVQRMYDDFYAFLLRCRIDGVKTDAQFMLDLISAPSDRRTLIRAYQDAWTLSSLKYMRNRSISCMSQTPQIIFHSQLPNNKPQVTLRNSDDFFPNEPDSHTWHIFCNAYNALFTQHLNVLPDWDMFQTTHEFGSYHAAARCISGGPVYITDEPGKHNTGLIRQMTARTIQNDTVTLRPSCVARAVSSSVYTSRNEPRLLKIGSYNGRSATGVGILGVFNTSATSLLDLVHLRDFRGVVGSQEYVIRAYSGGISAPMKLADPLPVISLHLEQRGWEILSSFPLEIFARGSEVVKIVPLGLIEKMSGAAAILRHDIDPARGTRLQIKVLLKALGLLGKP
jgi:hypothetical protein